jgi:hypothetical protein
MSLDIFVGRLVYRGAGKWIGGAGARDDGLRGYTFCGCALLVVLGCLKPMWATAAEWKQIDRAAKDVSLVEVLREAVGLYEKANSE